MESKPVWDKKKTEEIAEEEFVEVAELKSL